jgi:hypothetical protein
MGWEEDLGFSTGGSRHNYKERLKDTFYDSEGNSYKLFQRKWRSHKNRGSTKNRDYIIRKWNVDGEEVAYNGTIASKYSQNNASGDMAALKEGARTSTPDKTILTPGEYSGKVRADKESNRLDLKAHEAVAQAKQSAIDVTKTQTEIAQKQTARVSGEAIRAQRDALLAQGYSPEETRMMTAQGTENVARTIADVGMQGQALQAQTMGQLAQFGAEQGWTAENLSQGIKQMQQDLIKHREGLASQLQLAQLQARTQESVAGKAMWGEILGGVGEGIGGSTWNIGTQS